MSTIYKCDRCGVAHDSGYVEDSGERATLPSWRRAIVWRLTDAGRAALEKGTG